MAGDLRGFFGKERSCQVKGMPVGITTRLARRKTRILIFLVSRARIARETKKTQHNN
ncbi:MAG: hypothetical protein WA709_19725 [Stellaceae bacterium]